VANVLTQKSKKLAFLLLFLLLLFLLFFSLSLSLSLSHFLTFSLSHSLKESKSTNNKAKLNEMKIWFLGMPVLIKKCVLDKAVCKRR